MADQTAATETTTAATTEVTDTGADTTTTSTDTSTSDATTEGTTSTETTETAGTEKAAEQPGSWPTDWREQLAGGDAKLLAQLKRYSSPKTVGDAFFALRQKLSSGEFKKAAPPENATTEQMAEWRKENGIPDKSDAYDLTLSGGLVVGEDDKPLVGTFLDKMHAANAPQQFVTAALEAYYQTQEADMDAALKANEEAEAQTEDALRVEWGPEYRRNLNMIENFLSTAPNGVGDLIKNAMTGGGIKLLNSPDVMRFLADKAREINPVATLVGATGDINKSVADEIASIETRMREDRKGYFADEKMQARYAELLTYREKQK